MSRRLTLKQRKWLAVYLATGNATEAARQAYVCKTDGVARVIGAENIAKLNVPIEKLMDSMGLTDGYLMAKLGEGLNSDCISYAKFQGKFLDKKSDTDLPTRKTYLELALKVKGRLKDKIELDIEKMPTITGVKVD